LETNNGYLKKLLLRKSPEILSRFCQYLYGSSFSDRDSVKKELAFELPVIYKWSFLLTSQKQSIFS